MNLWLLAASLAWTQGAASFDDLVSQAAAARERNDVPRAIELYSQAVQLRPNWVSGWLFLGSMQYTAGSYAAARDALTHFIETAPDPGPAFALRALCEFEIEEYERSLADIQNSTTLGGPNLRVKEETLRYYKSLALTRLGRFDDALNNDSFFAQRQTTSPDILVAVGLAGLRMSLLPREIKQDQQDLLMSAGRAALEFMAGDEKRATEAFENLSQHFPQAPGVHSLYGYFLLASDLHRAVVEFKRELEIAPTNPEACILLAWALLMQKNPSAALPYAETAEEKSPGASTTQLVLGRSLSETGHLATGIAHLERALQLAPDDLEIHIALADAYSRSGRTDDAQRQRLQCLQMTKDGANRVALP